MGKRGPAKTPRKLAIVQGMQKDRIPDEPTPDQELRVEPPEGADLGVHGRREWDRLVGDLKSKVGLTGWDVHTFAIWCETVDRFWSAVEVLNREGMMLEETVFARGEPVGERYKLHPIWKAYQDAKSDIMRLSARYGFTPSDRAGLNVQTRQTASQGDDLLTG